MIESIEQLRQHFGEPSARAQAKVLSGLDSHGQRFIELSPFVVLSTASSEGRHDASPRGGDPGFVHVKDTRTLWFPDQPGNNRVDSLTNVVETGRLAALFLIPGVDETLRVNGSACVRDEREVLQVFDDVKHRPKVVVELAVEEAFLHCAKAFLRSGLWQSERRVPEGTLPTIGKMINDQLGIEGRAETRDEMRARYAKDL